MTLPDHKYAVIDKNNFVVGTTYAKKEIPNYTLVELSADDIGKIKSALKSKPRIVVKVINNALVYPIRSITKRELVDKLIAINKAAEFNAILNALPLDEKLRWEASPTIAPDYPYIAENKAQILAALQITEEELNSIFQ